MNNTRFLGWAMLVLLASIFTASTSGAHDPDMPYYSPLHYWLPGIYRFKASMQPVPADSPQFRFFHPQQPRDGRILGGRRAVPVEAVEEAPTLPLPSENVDLMPLAPR